MKNGGAREGAGRPAGSKAPHTLEAQEAKKRFIQRVALHTDRLFNAQFSLARGTTLLYRIDETGEGKDKKREHVLVTNEDEIKQVLDETNGEGGTVDDSYYYITTKIPDNKAIDSMLDRAHGRAPQSVDLTSGGDKINISLSEVIANKNALNPSTNGDSERPSSV